MSPMVHCECGHPFYFACPKDEDAVHWAEDMAYPTNATFALLGGDGPS